MCVSLFDRDCVMYAILDHFIHDDIPKEDETESWELLYTQSWSECYGLHNLLGLYSFISITT